MAANPLNYAGGSPLPPLATPAGGTIMLAGTTYAVSSIASVTVTTVEGERRPAGCVLASVSVLGIFLGIGFCGAASVGGVWFAAVGAVLLIASAVGLVKGCLMDKGRPLPAVLVSLVSGEKILLRTATSAEATSLAAHISSSMAAAGQTYVDNRQVHIHKHG